MAVRHALLTALAGVHLGLVLCGAVSLPLLSDDRPVTKALRLGRAMTGSDTNYGFFAPDVGATLEARFTLVDKDGRTWTDELDPGNTIESRLRINNVLAWCYEEELREQVAASLARSMLARHPTVVTVIVRIEEYNPPTFAEFRSGVRPDWDLLYEATVSRI
jgi:hypothetical protein